MTVARCINPGKLARAWQAQQQTVPNMTDFYRMGYEMAFQMVGLSLGLAHYRRTMVFFSLFFLVTDHESVAFMYQALRNFSGIFALIRTGLLLDMTFPFTPRFPTKDCIRTCQNRHHYLLATRTQPIMQVKGGAK